MQKKKKGVSFSGNWLKQLGKNIISSKLALAAIAIILIAFLIGYLYFSGRALQKQSENAALKNLSESSKNLPEFGSYGECYDYIVKNARIYGPAEKARAGTIRKDENASEWIKKSDGKWVNKDGKGIWGNSLINTLPGGVNYVPEEISFCKKYLFTHNEEMEKGFTEILNQLIEEERDKGVNLSIKKIEVLNLVNGVQGNITFGHEKLDSIHEDSIVGELYRKLAEKYPSHFATNHEFDSWVDINIKYNPGWRIFGGHYEIRA